MKNRLSAESPFPPQPLLQFEEIIPCRIHRRENRFVMLVEIKGKQFRAHLNNTGRLAEFLRPGKPAFCLKRKTPGKTTHRLIAAEERKKGALIDTQLQMRSFERALEKGFIPWLKGCRLIKRNTRLGNSLIDYLLNCASREIYLEIKSAVLRQKEIALYPDCPSQRGRRHLQELIALAENSRPAMVLFMAALPEVEAFRPNREADPQLFQILTQAQAGGVEVRAMRLFLEPTRATIILDNPDLPVLLT